MSSIKIRSKRLGDKMQIRTLIAHPMENGRMRDKDSDQLIPAHFIQELIVKHNDKTVISSHLSGSISKDPYFVFMLNNVNSGDKITISWVDNLNQFDSEDHFIK